MNMMQKCEEILERTIARGSKMDCLFVKIVAGDGDRKSDVIEYQLVFDYAVGWHPLAPRMETPQIEFDEATGRVRIYHFPPSRQIPTGGLKSGG